MKGKSNKVTTSKIKFKLDDKNIRALCYLNSIEPQAIKQNRNIGT